MKSNNGDDGFLELSPGEDDDTNKILDGKYVLIQRGEQERIIEYKGQESIKYGRGSNLQDVSLRNACGCLYYTTFRVKVQTEKQHKDPRTSGQLCYLEPVNVTESGPVIDRNNCGKDNRNIYDDNKSQPLGAYDIATMRESGVSGPEILDTLVAKSKSFAQKTEFSQEKYLKKKEKQYGDTIMFIKPTINIIADYYFQKDPVKIMNLRPDALSQMLTYSNVHAGGNFMVYETGCSGLVVASVLHRLGGLGTALHVHTGSTPQRQALFYMNFTTKDLEPLRSLDVFYIIRPTASLTSQASKLETPPDNLSSTSLPESDKSPAPKKSKLDDDLPETNSSQENIKTKETDDAIPSESTSAVAKLGNINRAENEKSLALFYSMEFDGLLICSKEHPLSILQCLLPRLGPSAPFAVFCQYPEPLVECYSWIKETNAAVNLSISENWTRNIQVESERTHPEINMNSNGGYLLFGINVKL